MLFPSLRNSVQPVPTRAYTHQDQFSVHVPCPQQGMAPQSPPPATDKTLTPQQKSKGKPESRPHKTHRLYKISSNGTNSNRKSKRSNKRDGNLPRYLHRHMTAGASVRLFRQPSSSVNRDRIHSSPLPPPPLPRRQLLLTISPLSTRLSRWYSRRTPCPANSLGGRPTWYTAGSGRS